MSTLPTDDKSRKALPIFTWLTEYFPDAIVELVKVSVAGNEQHNPGEPLHWARGKSMNQLDTAFRHMWDHKLGTKRDTDGQYHLAKTAWRALAELQLTIEADRAKPVVLPEIGAGPDVKVSPGRTDIYHACLPNAAGLPGCGAAPGARCLWLLGGISATDVPARE